MVNIEQIKNSLKDLEDKYANFSRKRLEVWRAWADASDRIYNGEEVREEEIPEAYHREYKIMKIVMEMEDLGEFDWNNPKLKNLFAKMSSGPFYQFFGKIVAEIVLVVARLTQSKTLIEIGAGQAKLSRMVCNLMEENRAYFPLIITDSNSIINETEREVRSSFPEIDLKSFQWNITEKPSYEHVKSIKNPALLYERNTLTYANYKAIANIAAISDTLVLGGWLNRTGEIHGFDRVFEKIGRKVLLLKDVTRELKRYYSELYYFDKKVHESVNLPYTTLLIAFK